MSANRKPRKKYRGPKYAGFNPLAMLRDHSTEGLSLEQLTNLMLAVHTSYQAIRTGHGCEEDIIHLAVASNIALILAERGMGPEYIPEVKAAQRHIVNLQSLWNAEQRAVLTGPGMDAIGRMLDLHDEQIKHPDATEATMRAALREIMLRMTAGNVQVPEAKPAALTAGTLERNA